MSNEVERDPEQQKPEQGKHDATGSVNPSDKKTTPSPGNQSQSNPAQDISKKNPSQDSDSHKGQQKPEDEKRRAS